MYLYIQSAPADAAALCIAIRTAVDAAAAAAVVRPHVPNGKICCWLIESDSIQCFLFKRDRFFMYVPLGSTAVAFTASICLYYILGNYGRQPAAEKPPLYMHISLYKVPLRDACDVDPGGDAS